MKRLFILIGSVLFTLLFWSPASSTIIQGTHQLSNGNYVNLGGLEWLSLQTTMDIPSDQMQEILASPDFSFEGFSDWRHATRTETENLLDSLWGGVAEGWHETNFEGAQWFMQNFGLADSGASWSVHRTGFMYGSEGNLYGVVYLSDSDPSEYQDLPEYLDHTGWFDDALGLSTGITPDNQVAYGNGGPMIGHMLVRDPAPIPEPSMVMLLLSGLAGLGAARKSRKITGAAQA